MKRLSKLLLFAIALLPAACSDDYTPKPRGYFRIALPERQYIKLDSIYPYTFEYPAYAMITRDELSPGQTNWINIDYPQFKGR
ncbi:MAG TPA: hypothetical protein PLP88_00940, partial [Bacteroidales bacterium]|nr:hypothetical protein [Bacteroidales bacterium]